MPVPGSDADFYSQYFAWRRSGGAEKLRQRQDQMRRMEKDFPHIHVLVIGDLKFDHTQMYGLWAKSLHSKRMTHQEAIAAIEIDPVGFFVRITEEKTTTIVNGRPGGTSYSKSCSLIYTHVAIHSSIKMETRKRLEELILQAGKDIPVIISSDQLEAARLINDQVHGTSWRRFWDGI